jgi:putative oxidoreductase
MAVALRLQCNRAPLREGTDPSIVVSKSGMFEQVSLREPRNVLGDWILRTGIAVVFVVFGAEKFPSDPGSPWIALFGQIGAGQWFRYFTGAVEVLGGILVLIPWTVTVGLALLACTMASAALILVFVIGRPADSVVSAGFFIALAAFWWNRRSH